MKIYIVRDSNYSDHDIKGVFTDPGVAEKFKAYHNYGYVETHYIIPKSPVANGHLYECFYSVGGVARAIRVPNHLTAHNWAVTNRHHFTARCRFWANNETQANLIASIRVEEFGEGDYNAVWMGHKGKEYYQVVDGKPELIYVELDKP